MRETVRETGQLLLYGYIIRAPDYLTRYFCPASRLTSQCGSISLLAGTGMTGERVKGDSNEC